MRTNTVHWFHKNKASLENLTTVVQGKSRVLREGNDSFGMERLILRELQPLHEHRFKIIETTSRAAFTFI
ncbi:hypothetical protein VR7878_00601 [Vibrio ruber DSM 16370]|uniref:Uncharacterized protein n=1 Tax=Vibrio ruber (strain DSM 16370 / JCM 11486 / BCRC 17186 / CECT 7878 / LMG 23124 / VR1) TaxID=1123498 RepID=A0A1R4LBT3_VIBR1|nr:hypothetical protein VR7878_00601 [Vibrio ruber DSM 16370]